MTKCSLFLTILSLWVSIGAQAFREDYPRSVTELKNIRDKSSIEYEVKSYEAAVDLKNLAINYSKSGFLEKALKYANVAAHLFPYRNDIVSLKVNLIAEFILVTNTYIKKSSSSCEIYAERLQFLKQISPDNLFKINPLKKCKSRYQVNKIIDVKYDVNSYIQIPTPRNLNISANKGAGLSSQLSRIVKKNNNREFPYIEQLYHGLRFLGNFSLYSDELWIDKESRNRSSFNIKGRYRTFWRSGDFSFNDFCQNLKFEIERFPSRENGSFLCKSLEIIPGTLQSNLRKPLSIKRLNTHRVYIAQEAPFSPLPNFLIFDLEYLGKNNRVLKKRSLVLKGRSIDPTGWLQFSGLRERLFDPYRLSHQLSFLSELSDSKLGKRIRFEGFNEFSLKKTKDFKIEELKAIKLTFRPRKTFDTYMKSLPKYAKRKHPGRFLGLFLKSIKREIKKSE